MQKERSKIHIGKDSKYKLTYKSHYNWTISDSSILFEVAISLMIQKAGNEYLNGFMQIIWLPRSDLPVHGKKKHGTKKTILKLRMISQACPLKPPDVSG